MCVCISGKTSSILKDRQSDMFPTQTHVYSPTKENLEFLTFKVLFKKKIRSEFWWKKQKKETCQGCAEQKLQYFSAGFHSMTVTCVYGFHGASQCFKHTWWQCVSGAHHWRTLLLLIGLDEVLVKLHAIL